VAYGGNNFTDFSDTQPTKFRVFIGRSRIFILPLNIRESSRFVQPWDGRPWQTQRTNKQTNGLVSSSVCVSDGVWHLHNTW